MEDEIISTSHKNNFGNKRKEEEELIESRVEEEILGKLGGSRAKRENIRTRAKGRMRYKKERTEGGS